jgi:hypothetical protein
VPPAKTRNLLEKPYPVSYSPTTFFLIVGNESKYHLYFGPGRVLNAPMTRATAIDQEFLRQLIRPPIKDQAKKQEQKMLPQVAPWN